MRGQRTFLVLAEELHFGRAAARLRVTQARVSQTIRTLETCLGVALVERSSRRVALTPLGEALEGQLRPAHIQIEGAVKRAAGSVSSLAGPLRIGVTPTTDTPEVHRLVEDFTQSLPECGVTLEEIGFWDPYGPLRRGEIDVLCNWLAVDESDLTVGPVIGEYRRVLMVAAGHRLATRESVIVEELGDEVVNGTPAGFPRELENALHPRETPSGRPIRRSAPIVSTAQVSRGLSRGDFVIPTVEGMRPWSQRPGVVQIPFADMPPLPLGLIWCTNHLNDRIRALASFAATGHTPEHAQARRSAQSADIESLEANELRAFLTLADELHFARTAERLHLSASRASQLIRMLEERLGAPLFDRTSRRVQLTPLGVQLCDALGPAYRNVVAAREQVRQLSRVPIAKSNRGETHVPERRGKVKA